MPQLRSPQDLLATELREIHSAEKQLSRTLPRLARRVSSERLREMLEERVEQGSILVERIEDALEDMQVAKGRQKNIAAEGLIDDMTHHMEEIQEDKLLDPLLLGSVQKIEHYCIAAWGTAAAMGRLLGQEKVVKTMEQVLKEGKEFDDRMTELAEKEVNPRLLDGAEEEEEGGSGSKRGGRRS